MTFERDRAECEDLKQDVAVALWRALSTWRGDCTLRTFVARVTHNVCVCHVRRAARKPNSEDLKLHMRTNLVAPEEATARNEQGRRLAAAVFALPRAQRDVAVLTLEGFAL